MGRLVAADLATGWQLACSGGGAAIATLPAH